MEVRTLGYLSAEKLCRYWKAGNCKNGSDCKFSHGNEDSWSSEYRSTSTSTVETDNFPATHSTNESQRICRYWKAGSCKNGSDCKFSHGREDSWVSECPSTSTNTVDAENSPATHSTDESQICPYWKAGNCKNAWDCKFSHGNEDSWASEYPSTSTSTIEAVNSPATHSTTESQKICRYWKAGRCKNGSDCKFSHGSEDSWSSEGWSTSTSTVETDNSSATHSTDESQNICPYWQAGNCKNAWDCKFSHGNEDSWASECPSTSTSAVEAVNPPATHSTDENQICPYWKAGNCKNAWDCKFSHGSENSWASECSSVSTSAVETVDSLATRSPDESQKICRYWKAGNCKNAWDCKFSHESDDSWASECQSASTTVEAVNPTVAHSSDESQKICRYWKAGHCTNGSDCEFSHGYQDSPPTPHSQDDRQRICRYWKAGNCKNAWDCKFSHASEDSRASECQSPSTTTVETVNLPTNQSRDERRKLCYYWKMGNCKYGRECKFLHGSEDSPASDCRSSSTSATEVVTPLPTLKRRTLCRYWKAGNCIRGDICWFRHANDEPANSKTAQREAAETIGRAVHGPIVTLSAGLDIIGLTAGFESCILHVKNISAGAKEDDLRALMSQQGMDADRIYLVGVKTVGGGKVEAGVMTDE
ncbi:hypothetical protein EDC04DRAFT_225169 [Pisolithus marmoratus]|nr:hypothetical protein EDC04DRAFT_225169 [Pisolithus marmoratus]